MGTTHSKRKKYRRRSHRGDEDVESKENRPPSRSTSYTTSLNTPSYSASLNPNRLSAEYDFNLDEENKRTIYLSRDSLFSSHSRVSSLAESQMSNIPVESYRRSLTSISTKQTISNYGRVSSLGESQMSNTPAEPYRRSLASLSTNQSNVNSSNRTLKVDNHPELTRLQNEQNARVEYFENRLNKIRTSAMQAADRKKFAYLFRAKDKPEKLNDAIDVSAQYKTAQHGFHPFIEEEDKGEIIPVHVIKGSNSSSDSTYKKESSPPRIFDNINPFNDIRIFLLLPFLLPFFIIICLLRGLSLGAVNVPRTSSLKCKKVSK